MILPNADLESAAAAAARALERLHASAHARHAEHRRLGLDRGCAVAAGDEHRRSARGMRCGAAALQAPGQGARHSRAFPSRSPEAHALRLCETGGSPCRARRRREMTMSQNSFGAKDTLEVGERKHEIFRLDALQQRFDVARLPFSLKVLLENLLRTEGNGSVDRSRHRGARRLGREGAAQQGDRLHPGARADAGLHRRARRGRPRGDARRDGRDGRRPRQDQPACAGRARDRPLRPGRRLRHARRLPLQRRARVRAQPGALRLPALGPGRLRRLRCGAARHRDRAPGQPRVPRAGRLREREDRPGLPRHARRHRLPHHDGQRPRRARLGRGRDRGRGGDARPADVDADPAGARRAACTASCPRARPPPTSC